MIRDAEANQESDAKRKEAVEAKNELDSLVHSVEKSLNEHGEKLDEKTKTEVSEALDAAKKIDSEAAVEAVKEMVTNLSGASMKIGQAIYAKKGDDAPQDGASTEKKADDAQEAEFTEKKK
jgi:molecular chaperone DnaK